MQIPRSSFQPSSLFTVAALLAGLWAAPAARAAGPEDFVLAGDDGYGVADCMKPGMECGRVMADAWCEAHGHGRAAAFGLSDDVTGSTKISAVSASAPPAGAVVIRCGD